MFDTTRTRQHQARDNFNDRVWRSNRGHSRQSRWQFRLIRLFLVGALVILATMPWRASAQSSAGSWATPLNLSHSGGTTNPAIVIDSDGVVHALWQDVFSEFVYTRFEADQWSEPQLTDLDNRFRLPTSQAGAGQTEVPLYTGPNPVFVAGPGQFIFGFWINQRGRLYAGRVLNRNFNAASAWSAAQLGSASVASFAVSVDLRGQLHLAYLQNMDVSGAPAGIYYTRSRSGEAWAAPVLLYDSPYFRGLGGDQASLSLATAGTADAPLIYVAWDNRPRKRVFLARSADGGVTWEEPVQVAGPTPDSGLNRPYNIRVGATANSVVLVWQSGKPGEVCTHLFQSSRDAGATWSQAQLLLADLPGCAQANEFVPGLAPSPAGLVYLLTLIQGQSFLSAWNGSQWSQPQAQPILAGFEDPDVYSQVAYDCRRATMFGKRLYVVGCDGGGGGDIWVTSRDLESRGFEFSPPVWSPLATIPGDAGEVAATQLIATGDGLIHTLFSRLHDPAIYYTRWDGASWSRIAPAMELPEGEVGWPAVAAGPKDVLFLIAQGSNGSLYFSQADSREALKKGGWSTPTRLQIVHDGEAGPADVAWDAAGTLYIAYSVPVNEARGVYLVESSDQGRTWSNPVQVFTGAATGFDFVGPPSLVVLANGSVHVGWSVQSVEADGVAQPRALYYAHSEGAGHAFSEAERVVNAPVAWQALVTDVKGNLHRLWQQTDLPTSLWDQVSRDGGRSWDIAQQLAAEDGPAAVTVDPAGRLHLLSAGGGPLAHWLWDGSRWQAQAPLRGGMAQGVGPVEGLGAALNADGKMVVVLVLPTDAAEGKPRLLRYATRLLELPPRPATPQETPTPLPPSPAAASATPPPQPSPTLAATIATQSVGLQNPSDRSTASDPMTQFVVALLPVVIVLLTVLGIMTLRAVRFKAR